MVGFSGKHGIWSDYCNNKNSQWPNFAWNIHGKAWLIDEWVLLFFSLFHSEPSLFWCRQTNSMPKQVLLLWCTERVLWWKLYWCCKIFLCWFCKRDGCEDRNLVFLRDYLELILWVDIFRRGPFQLVANDWAIICNCVVDFLPIIIYVRRLKYM